MPYLGKQSEQVGVSVQKYEYLQGTDTSSGATSFSVPSDSGDHVNVWLNGVLLVEGGSDDYSKSNTAITFNSAPADGDIVRIDVVESFALPDALKSSGDTMSGALKLNGGIKQQTSADLSGTYADHQVMLSDSYSVTGDVTISDNLVLAKISDDSNAVTLTNDTSTRSITGTGSLEASTLVQTPNASLTGMTGEIGSDVTFPAGHIIKTQMTSYTSSAALSLGASAVDMASPFDGTMSFTPIQSTPNLIVHFQINTTPQMADWSSELVRAYYKVGSSGSYVQFGLSGFHRGFSGAYAASQHNAVYQTIGVAGTSGITMGSETALYFKFTVEKDASGGMFQPNAYEIESSSSATTLSSAEIEDFGSYALIQEIKV